MNYFKLGISLMVLPFISLVLWFIPQVRLYAVLPAIAGMIFGSFAIKLADTFRELAEEDAVNAVDESRKAKEEAIRATDEARKLLKMSEETANPAEETLMSRPRPRI